MNVIDLIIIIIIVALCIRGYLKGFINELFSLGIIIFGLIGAFLFYRSFSMVVQSFIQNSDLSLIFSFFVIFIAISIILIIVRNTVINIIDRVNLTDFDYILGVIIGLFKGILLCGIIFIFLKNHPVFKIEVIILKSRLFPLIERVCMSFISLLPQSLTTIIDKILGINYFG